ncbi:L-aspartate oxidase [Microbacterium hominis]|uniref:L-aspartate oxidase n=1 Tax=Microbacterium hominis TaxID=162426 RepID=A0A7D4Q0C3_9MICO|nr:L-aspartate oxidase [Microbacterium hominis]QKJ19092.1 L-aspartate oxidase [Microbacterium hominis]
MTAPAASPHAVVVGSGIAGLLTALHAVESGCRVTLVTKDVLEHANTRYAQGGIAGVTFADDRIADHIADTLAAGAGLNDRDAVRVLAEEGPARIAELVALGVEFDRAADGAFVKGLEAAHSYPRILHAGGDATGTAIEKALVERLRMSDVRVIEHAFLVDLVVEAGRAAGVDLIVGETDAAPGRREGIAADAVVLATGGAGELYAHSTNPEVATGDGIAAAIRAGAAVADLEFFQFHPTVLPGGDGAGAARDSFLVSEAVRGEGATLIDDRGRRFALDAHPAGELAPRDVVARSIADAMEAQGGRPVRLDATHLHAAEPADRARFLAERFPTIDRAVRERGFDWALDPIPVTPAAHYLMGGIVTDLDGRTTIPGLYAVGETARTGVHGANRLASNSLLEGAVFGSRAGDAIAADAASGRWPHVASPGGDPDTADAPPADAAREGAAPEGAAAAPAADAHVDAPPFTRTALQHLMWERAGLVRDGAGLSHAAAVLRAWRQETRAPRTERAFEDENLLLVADRLVDAAIARRTSVGAHFRSDDPRATPEESPLPAPSAATAAASGPILRSSAPHLPRAAADPAAAPTAREALAC